MRARVKRGSREIVLGRLFLEIEVVEIGLAGLAQRIERSEGTAPAMWDAHRHDGGENIGPHQCRVPSDRRAPVVADDQRALFAERRHERDHVADIVKDGVGGDLERR